MLNERYLHHYFSHMLQQKWDLLNLPEDSKLRLHLEWPTYKKQTRLQYGQYAKANEKYLSNPEGTAGFIDFALGCYYKSEIGIEFSLKYGWSNGEMIYDFLKLLDPKNPFKLAISLNLILRKRRLTRGARLTSLENHLNSTLQEATSRLKDQICDEQRKLLFIITEIAQDNTRRHWTCNNIKEKFKKTNI